VAVRRPATILNGLRSVLCRWSAINNRARVSSPSSSNDRSGRTGPRSADSVGDAVTCPTRGGESVPAQTARVVPGAQVKPRRADDATRIILAGLSRFLAWRQLLLIVTPETLIRWHRQGFRLFWRWTSRTPGRPAIARDVQRLIATMAVANRTWGEERIANELLLKLGIRVSPRTVRRYMPSCPWHPKRGTQAWSTFVRNHAGSLLASDFFVVVTATFRMVYVFVVLEVGTRRILQWNVTAHPTADWTAQQFG